MLSRLREMLEEVGVPDAALYRTQDLRRGHNEDIVAAGGGLLEVLTAGGWLAPGAHKSYTDLVQLEMRVCSEAHDACLNDDDE